MRNTLLILILSGLFLSTAHSWAKSTSRTILPVEKCLNVTSNTPLECMQKHLSQKSIKACYEVSEKIYSYRAREMVKDYCFYNISEFSNLKSCTEAARKFFFVEERDQALFECYRQSSETIDQRSCLDLSKLMTFREKRNYLANHCRTL